MTDEELNKLQERVKALTTRMADVEAKNDQLITLLLVAYLRQGVFSGMEDFAAMGIDEATIEKVRQVAETDKPPED